MYCCSLSLVIFFALKFTSSDINIAIPSLLWLMFTSYVFFSPLTFNLSISLYLKWVSYRQHKVRLYFKCISTKSGLIIGTDGPFTFRVIIDMLKSAIYLLFSVCFPYFSFICFLFLAFLWVTWTFFGIPFWLTVFFPFQFYWDVIGIQHCIYIRYTA